MGTQTALATAQSDALLEARARYEHGDISFEVFKDTFNAIMATTDASHCQTIIQALPNSALVPLDALERRRTSPPRHMQRSRIFFTLIGELNKTRRPWRMGEHTTSLALIGEQTLDLSLAELPERGTLRVVSFIGEATIYVPRSLQVTVRSFTLIGAINAFGEEHGGILSLVHEEHVCDEPTHELVIEAFSLIGEINIVLVDGPVMFARP